MADADALLIRKHIVAALERGNAHTDLGKAFGTRSAISFRYLAEERATESSAAFRPRRTLLPLIALTPDRYLGVGPEIHFTAPDAPSMMTITFPPRLLTVERTDQSP
jgi:hypothetical protein